jgi:hypothetical protein
MARGDLEMTTREEWPTVCEARTIHDLAALKKLAS